jgi:predicted MPP superfamily phosphohydrolase
VRESFAQLAEFAPDLVALTGDFVTNNHDDTAPLAQARSVYSSLPRGRIATVGILGNHDYGWSFADTARAAEVVDLLGDTGVRMLRNECLNLDGLEIIGLDELWAGRCGGQSVFSRAANAEARLALCHNPDAVDLPMWGNYRGWILSGHTHGGQCKPPFLPPPLLPVRNRRYTSGEFDLFDGRRLYVNRGLGHLRPVRFNARPEITLFKLTRSEVG